MCIRDSSKTKLIKTKVFLILAPSIEPEIGYRLKNSRAFFQNLILRKSYKKLFTQFNISLVNVMLYQELHEFNKYEKNIIFVALNKQNIWLPIIRLDAVEIGNALSIQTPNHCFREP